MALPRLVKLDPVPGTWGSLSPKPRTKQQLETDARGLLGQLSLDEKIHQMSGDSPFLRGTLDMLRAYNQEPIPAGENQRLGIPGIRFSDGPRGVVMYRSTCFPVAIARGAAWDVDLEERIGDAIGVEARTQGANFFGGVCINLLRHPAWGRAQETYGEEPHHLGELGSALVRGSQRHVMACVKHYAANSMENARFRVDVRMDPRTLHEVYLPHFRRCVEAGAASVMSAYNKVNGHFCGHHRELLRDILKGDWGFEGFVISDFTLGVRSARAAAAGLDIEMPFTWRFGRKLKKLVTGGTIPESVIDEAVLRILRQKLRFASVGEPERYRRVAVAGAAHRALAREAARKSIVLLQNHQLSGSDRPVLPLDRAATSRIAVIGKLATTKNLGDLGSSRVRPPSVVTALQGIRAAAGPEIIVDHEPGEKLEDAVAAARRADVTILVAGYTHVHEGEYIFLHGGDRDRLTLEPGDEERILAIAAIAPRCVVVMIGGSAIVTEAWRHSVPALLMAWYPGMEGGHAIADLLFGEVSPSGKLPCVFPASASQLPPFDKKARVAEYGYLHGQRWLDDLGLEPAFPLGFGLSYTSFAYANLTIAETSLPADGTLRVGVDVTNTGAVAGDEIVQLYISYPGSEVARPAKELKAFARVSLEPAETRRVDLEVPVGDLAYYRAERRDWVVEPLTHAVQVGPSSETERSLRGTFQVKV